MKKVAWLYKQIYPKGKWKLVAIIVMGSFVGLFIYTFFASRAYSYLSDKPETCVNCHVMGPYYATWNHSSHAQNATCNDCHVPHNNSLNKWFFKAKDGLRHAAVFTLGAESQVMMPIAASSEVIMNNCIRCHGQLNTEFVKTGKMGFKDLREMGGMACWDCHRDVPHTRSRSLSSTPNGIIPYLSEKKKNIPYWLKQALKRKEEKK